MKEKSAVRHSKAAAKEAGLRYADINRPGIRRMRSGKSFRYLSASNKSISRDDQTRIESLVLPPAWNDVWICADANGHVQAVGTDAAGRRQYRYHPKWRSTRDENKYGRMLSFVAALPKLRRRVRKDMKLPGMPREKIVAAVVRLLETTLIRIGNDEYAKTNKSYGLTTLHNRHAKVKGESIEFHFRGKSGVQHDIDLHDPRLAKIVRTCQELPGAELFGYVDEKKRVHDIGSTDVNAYLQDVTGQPFTAKDFRTWAGTVLAATELLEFEEINSQAARKKNVVVAIEKVAKRLGNTRAVCRKCYIHPTIIETYLNGSFAKQLLAKAGKGIAKHIKHLPKEEAAVVVLLQNSLAQAAKRKQKV